MPQDSSLNNSLNQSCLVSDLHLSCGRNCQASPELQRQQRLSVVWRRQSRRRKHVRLRVQWQSKAAPQQWENCGLSPEGAAGPRIPCRVPQAPRQEHENRPCPDPTEKAPGPAATTESGTSLRILSEEVSAGLQQQQSQLQTKVQTLLPWMLQVYKDCQNLRRPLPGLADHCSKCWHQQHHQPSKRLITKDVRHLPLFCQWDCVGPEEEAEHVSAEAEVKEKFGHCLRGRRGRMLTVITLRHHPPTPQYRSKRTLSSLEHQEMVHYVHSKLFDPGGHRDDLHSCL